jgi:hypothetical protein
MIEALKSGWRMRRGATLTMLLCVIASALAACGSSDGSSEAAKVQRDLPDRYPGATVPIIEQASSLQVRGFPLFRTLPEGLPAAVEKILRQPTYGMNWKLAQRIPTTARGRFWAVPGRGVICVLAQQNSETVSSNCTKMPHAVAHGLAVILVSETRSSPTPSYRRLMVGIAPAGARAIRVYDDGSKQMAQVREGGFTLWSSAGNPPRKMVPLG